jgi:hypothetical protein
LERKYQNGDDHAARQLFVMQEIKPQMIPHVYMRNFCISFMEQNDIRKAAQVLSIAMLENPHHVGVFLGHGENERLQIEKMFFELLTNLPAIVFLAKENGKSSASCG